jgi:putative membrane protein
LLRKHHLTTVSLLAGFMLGSLNKVWPWKQTLTYYTDSKGGQHPLTEENLSPWAYETLTGLPAQTILALTLAVLGAALILGLEAWGRHRSQSESQTTTG